MNRKELIEALWYPDGFAECAQHKEGNPNIEVFNGPGNKVEILSIYYDEDGTICIDVGTE